MFTTSSGCKNDQSWLNVEWTKCVLDSLALDARYKPQDTNLGLVFALSSVWVQMPIPCCSSLGKKILFWTPLNSKLIQRQWKIQIHFLFLEKKICIGVLKYSSLKAVKVCTCICYVQNSPNCHKFFFSFAGMAAFWMHLWYRVLGNSWLFRRSSGVKHTAPSTWFLPRSSFSHQISPPCEVIIKNKQIYTYNSLMTVSIALA